MPHLYLLQEYLGIGGDAQFCKLSAQLAFGESSPALREQRTATVQCLSGTGSLRVRCGSCCALSRGPWPACSMCVSCTRDVWSACMFTSCRACVSACCGKRQPTCILHFNLSLRIYLTPFVCCSSLLHMAGHCSCGARNGCHR